MGMGHWIQGRIGFLASFGRKTARLNSPSEWIGVVVDLQGMSETIERNDCRLDAQHAGHRHADNGDRPFQSVEASTEHASLLGRL